MDREELTRRREQEMEDLKVPSLRNSPERTSEPLGAILFDRSPDAIGDRGIRNIGAFRSARDLEQFIESVAADEGATRVDYTLYHQDGRVEEFMAIPAGQFFDYLGDEPFAKDATAPVVVFQRDRETGIPIPVGAYARAGDFYAIIDWAENQFAKDKNSNVRRSVDDLEFVIVPVANFWIDPEQV